MSAVVIRLGILVVVSLAVWLTVWAGKRYVGRSRRRALNSAPIVLPQAPGASRSSVSILAFSSADCRQCKQLQEPALQRVLQARSGSVAVVEVDAPSSPDLTEHYSVLTLPTTVVLDASGKAHAVNYGFAPAQRLLEQVDALLKTGAQEPQPAL